MGNLDKIEVLKRIHMYDEDNNFTLGKKQSHPDTIRTAPL